MTTYQKGAVAETAIIHAAIKVGIGVLVPGVEERYDLVLDLHPRLVRVQCKWAVRRATSLPFRVAPRAARAGIVHRWYTADEIDAFGAPAYCAALDRCYLLPLSRFGGRSGIRLRLESPRNNQQRGINWAREYEFDRLDWATLGP